MMPTSGGDTGQGDNAGSESLSDKTFPPASILGGVHVAGPTDGWGDWTDPRAHIAYAAALTTAAFPDWISRLRCVADRWPASLYMSYFGADRRTSRSAAAATRSGWWTWM